MAKREYTDVKRDLRIFWNGTKGKWHIEVKNASGEYEPLVQTPNIEIDCRIIYMDGDKGRGFIKTFGYVSSPLEHSDLVRIT